MVRMQRETEYVEWSVTEIGVETAPLPTDVKMGKLEILGHRAVLTRKWHSLDVSLRNYIPNGERTGDTESCANRSVTDCQSFRVSWTSATYIAARSNLKLYPLHLSISYTRWKIPSVTQYELYVVN